jgi:tetratricopeptide (TPR) repeat protein
MNRFPVTALLAAASLLATGCKSADQEKAEARYAQAEDWFHLTKYNEAKGLYKEALDLTQGDYPEAALGLGNTFRELCKIESQRYIDGKQENGIDVARVQFLYTEAEKFLSHALATRTNYRDAHYGLGLLYYETGLSKTIPIQLCRTPGEATEFKWVKLMAARDHFEKAWRFDVEPRSGAPQEYLALIFNLLGVEAVRQNDLRGASDFFEKSLVSSDFYIKWVRDSMRPKMDPRLFDVFESRLSLFEAMRADLFRSMASIQQFQAEQHVRGSDIPGAVALLQKARAGCDAYLSWLEKQPVPATDPEFKNKNRQAVLDMKSKIDKSLTDLGKPPAPEPPATPAGGKT